jgi:MFS family permease
VGSGGNAVVTVLTMGAVSTPVDAPEGTSPAGRWDRATAALLAGFFAGSAGATALVTALGKQVYDLSGRELDLGLLGLAEFAPAALLVLVTGTVADRVDRRLVASLAAAGEGVVALLVVAYVGGSPTAGGPLVAGGLGVGVGRAFVAPASRSLPADIVPADRLPWLTARWSITFQVALITGPVLAGTMYAVDPAAPFVVAAGLFAASSVAFALIPSAARRARLGAVGSAAPTAGPAVAAAAAEASAEASAEAAGAGVMAPAAKGRLHDALEGLRVVRRQPILLGAISLDLFAVLFGGAVALLPAIAEERLGVGAVGFGWLRAAHGIGASVVMLALAFRPVRRRVGATLLVAVATFGAGTIVLGATRSYAVAFAALLVLAGADALSVFIRVTLVPLVTPPSARGRVLAVENVFIGASNELGAFESGVTGQALGPAPAVALGGVATLVVAASWSRLFPALRAVDRFPSTAADADAART